jgi:hypothetical protein
MFFPDKITLIKPADRVLEIGPGGSPHPRSNVFLEMRFDDAAETERQRAFAKPLRTDKPVVYYDGGMFPFEDAEFDYIICSHVLEHVEDVPQFLNEVFRTGRSGYFEYPTIYYEYLYNLKEHLNLLKKQDDVLFYMPKSASGLAAFQPVQQLFYDSLKSQYFDIVEDLKPWMIEGFEWQGPFRFSQSQRIDALCVNAHGLRRQGWLSRKLRMLLHRLFA